MLDSTARVSLQCAVSYCALFAYRGRKLYPHRGVQWWKILESNPCAPGHADEPSRYAGAYAARAATLRGGCRPRTQASLLRYQRERRGERELRTTVRRGANQWLWAV